MNIVVVINCVLASFKFHVRTSPQWMGHTETCMCGNTPYFYVFL